MSGNNYHALVGSEVYSSDGSDVGSVKAIAGNDGETRSFKWNTTACLLLARIAS